MTMSFFGKFTRFFNISGFRKDNNLTEELIHCYLRLFKTRFYRGFRMTNDNSSLTRQ